MHENLEPWFDVEEDGVKKKTYIPDHLIKPFDFHEKRETYVKLAKAGYALAKTYFKVDLYFTQALILGACMHPKLTRIHIMTTTRYGKSFTLSMLAEIMAGIMHKEVNIGAADEEKAKIIMDKVVKALGKASPILRHGLIGKDVFEKAQTSIGKSKLAWHDGGSIGTFGLSGRIKNSAVSGAAGVGVGGDVVILDESALIADENYSTARRILAEKTSTKLIELSNPHQKNHFWKDYNDPKIFHIHMDKQTMLEENRLTPEKLEEAESGMTKKEKKIYFDVQFPEDNEFTYFKPQKWKTLPPIVEYYGALDLSLGQKQENFINATNSTKGCFTAGVVIGVDKDNIKYEIETYAGPYTPDEAMDWLFSGKYKFKRFGIEAVLFQQLVVDQARKRSLKSATNKKVPIIAIKQRKNKLVRIEGLEPMIINGEILLHPDETEIYTEMGDYGVRKARVDALDALEMCYRLIPKKAPGEGYGQASRAHGSSLSSEYNQKPVSKNPDFAPMVPTQPVSKVCRRRR